MNMRVAKQSFAISCPSAGIGSRCGGSGWNGAIQYSTAQYSIEHFRANETHPESEAGPVDGQKKLMLIMTAHHAMFHGGEVL